MENKLTIFSIANTQEPHGQIFYLANEKNEILGSHFCTSIRYAKDDLITSRLNRDLNLEKYKKGFKLDNKEITKETFKTDYKIIGSKDDFLI